MWTRKKPRFPDAVQRDSGASLIGDRPELDVFGDPGSAAHHCASLHAALRPGNATCLLRR